MVTGRKKRSYIYSFCIFAFLHDDDLESRHNIGYHWCLKRWCFFLDLCFSKNTLVRKYKNIFQTNLSSIMTYVFRLTGLWITNSRLLGCFVNIYPIQQDGGTANSAIGDGLSLNWFLQHLSLIICALFSAAACSAVCADNLVATTFSSVQISVISDDRLFLMRQLIDGSSSWVIDGWSVGWLSSLHTTTKMSKIRCVSSVFQYGMEVTAQMKW